MFDTATQTISTLRELIFLLNEIYVLQNKSHQILIFHFLAFKILENFKYPFCPYLLLACFFFWKDSILISSIFLQLFLMFFIVCFCFFFIITWVICIFVNILEYSCNILEFFVNFQCFFKDIWWSELILTFMYLWS